MTTDSKDLTVDAAMLITEHSRGPSGYPVYWMGALDKENHRKLINLIRGFCTSAGNLYKANSGQDLVGISLVYSVFHSDEASNEESK